MSSQLVQNEAGKDIEGQLTGNELANVGLLEVVVLYVDVALPIVMVEVVGDELQQRLAGVGIDGIDSRILIGSIFIFDTGSSIHQQHTLTSCCNLHHI